MKKLLVLVLLMLASISPQAVEVTPFGGYSMQSTSYMYYGYLRFHSSGSYGVNLGFPVSRGTQLELQWAGSSQWGEWYDYYDADYDIQFDSYYNYFLFGPLKEVVLGSPNVSGFGTFKIGMAHYSVKGYNTASYDDFRFAMSMGGGFKIFFTDMLGLRLQGNLHMPMLFNGIGFGLGTGGITGGASGMTVLVQGEMSAGLILRFGKQKSRKSPTVYTPPTTTAVSTVSTTNTKEEVAPDVVAKSEDISENLDLEAIGSLFLDSKDLEEFEKKLNDSSLQVTNLDMSGDGQVDYLRVISISEGDGHLVVIQSVIGKEKFQDVATIEIGKDEAGKETVQIVGDTHLYGENYVVVPVYTTSPSIVVWFGSPYYSPWYSPYYYGYYPPYYRPWRPHPVHYYRGHHYRRSHYRYNRPPSRPRNSGSRVNNTARRNDYGRSNPNKSFNKRNSGASNKSNLNRSKATPSRSNSKSAKQNWTKPSQRSNSGSSTGSTGPRKTNTTNTNRSTTNNSSSTRNKSTINNSSTNRSSNVKKNNSVQRPASTPSRSSGSSSGARRSSGSGRSGRR